MESEYLSVDTECTGPSFHKTDRPYYISTCNDSGAVKCWRFDVDPLTRLVSPQKKILDDVQDWLNSHNRLVFHNAKFDIRALRSVGLYIPTHNIEDTLLLSHLHSNRDSHKLKDLAELYLGIDVDDETSLLDCIAKARTRARKLQWNIAKSDRQETEGEPWMKMDGWIPGQLHFLYEDTPEEWAICLERYGKLDAERTMGLFLLYLSWLNGDGSNCTAAYHAQLRSLPSLIGLEDRGVSVRSVVLSENISHYQERAQQFQDSMRLEVGVAAFNPRSTKQLQTVLYDVLKLPVVKRTKTGSSTDKETLAYLYTHHKSRFLEYLIAYRKCGTALSYLESYRDCMYGGRVHSSFNPVGTDTTRLSSSNPNLQNVGKGSEFSPEHDWGAVAEDDYKLREAFGPLAGRIWLDADYDQLQLRIFAYISGEKRLIKAFDEGWDAHNFVACQIYKTDKPTKLQRRIAKNVNFGFIFGAQEEKIIAVSGDPEVWNTVNRLFPNAVKFLEQTSNDVRRCGYVDVPVAFAGPEQVYRLHVPRDGYGRIKAYTGVCYKVQGLEGLIVKRAMSYAHSYLTSVCKVKRDLDYGYLTLQVHDELISDFRKTKDKEYLVHGAMLKKYMEKAGKDYGVKTPASMCVVEAGWDSPQELSV